MRTGPLQLIEDPGEFTELLATLRSELLVGADTEAASFHRYLDRVYLLQLSTRTETWIVDPLAVTGLPGLGDLLGDPGIEFVFHDGDYDLRLLGHEFGFRVARVFDTRIAAQFLNEPGVGLATLLEKYFKVTLDKRFQRADWSARPLLRPLLEYAATDTRYLAELRDVLRQRLLEAGRLSWVEEECELLREVRWPEPELPEGEALRMKGARALSARALAVLRELYVWRDQLARALDRAPFRILGNESLLAMANHPPQNSAMLRRVPGLGKETRERRGSEILEAVRRGLALPQEQLPRFPRNPRHRPDPALERRLGRLKAVRATESARLNLPPGVVAPNWLLEAVARGAPSTPEELARTPGIRRWQLNQLGPQFLAALG